MRERVCAQTQVTSVCVMEATRCSIKIGLSSSDIIALWFTGSGSYCCCCGGGAAAATVMLLYQVQAVRGAVFTWLITPADYVVLEMKSD